MRTVCHITTAHQADDVRIFERECRSLTQLPDTRVVLAGAGSIPSGSGVEHLQLPDVPKNRFQRFAVASYRVLFAARRVNADVYHFHDPEALPTALWLARRGRTVIWDAHEDYLAQLDGGVKDWMPTWTSGAVRKGTSGALDRIDRRAAAVVAATPTIAAGYRNPRTTVVGNGARLADFDSAHPHSGSRQVLFTGHLDQSHCFAQVVEAVTRVQGLTLAVAGHEPDPIQWAAARRSLGERITHLGWLSREALADAASQSVVGLATYADTPTYAVAEPTKLFEFAACALPVVVTPNPGMTAMDGIEGVGVIAAGFTGEDLARALRRAVFKVDAWKEMSARGRAFARERGSWHASEELLLDLYRALLPAAAGLEAGKGAHDCDR